MFCDGHLGMNVAGWDEGAGTYVGFTFLYAGVAVRIRHFGGFAETRRDGSVDEAQEGNRAQGDGDDGPVVVRDT